MADLAKVLNGRIQCKCDTLENWNKVPAQTFMPLKGELIIFLSDENNPAPRFKVGDGEHFIEGLEFSDKNLEDYMPISGGEFTGNISAPQIESPVIIGQEFTAQTIEADYASILDLQGGSLTLGSSTPIQLAPLTNGAIRFIDTQGITENGNIGLKNIATPTIDTDAANKSYVDSYVNGEITLLETYIDDQDADIINYVNERIYQGAEVPTDTTMLWIDTDDNSETGGSGGTDSGIVGNYLPLTGGTMGGTINMNGNKISNLVTPTADSDAATKKYVEDYVSANGGGSSTGGLTQVFHAGTSAPSNTNLLWIDTNTSSGGLKYYNGSSWTVVPVAYV